MKLIAQDEPREMRSLNQPRYGASGKYLADIAKAFRQVVVPVISMKRALDRTRRQSRACPAMHLDGTKEEHDISCGKTSRWSDSLPDTGV